MHRRFAGAARFFALLAPTFLALGLITQHASAQDLILNNTSMTLGGVHRYQTVRLTNNATLTVTPFNGTDRVNTGNLVIIADNISIDATSTVTARGAGYTTLRCADGRGPTTRPDSGGRGGCSVRDSGGGGAHFGRGGRGTTDCNLFGSATSCQFPNEFESNCGNTLASDGLSCTNRDECRPSDRALWTGEPTVAGTGWFHSIYDVEFGASGGDKGCRDGDGFGGDPAVGGAGGGRIVLVALRGDSTGLIHIDGTVSANGRRGCGIGNDSGGGGAGGSVFVVGDRVEISATGRVLAAGGLGGDTRSAASDQPDHLDCPSGAQTGGTCDDCGGGGGGGIIAVQSRVANFADGATFNVGGALGGTCDICAGEAGGGAGELQLDGLYVGEICDGYDNDFDGNVDENLGNTTCGLGACATTPALCDTSRGVPNACVPATTAESCFAARGPARPRISVILDTSASMLLDLQGRPTFGDGSTEHAGLDTDGDGRANDSRLYLAREALGNVISAYPEIDFSLARYHQDMASNRFCQNAAWFECAGIVGTYDDPRDNTGAEVCRLTIGAAGVVPVRANSLGDECINYAGSCGGPRRGADILSGFGQRTRDLVRWLDGRETNFIDDETAGDVCDHSTGGDCELRGAGPTPLAGSLEAVMDYVVPVRTTDAQRMCRNYSVILVTDGAESCNGSPSTVARTLHDDLGIDVYVVAVSVLASEEASLNGIAVAGSGGTRPQATFVRAPEDLVPALTEIIQDSIRIERCNGSDDDCDGLVDEGFAGLGTMCDDGGRGVCRGVGTIACAPDELSTRCNITSPGGTAGTEVCNGLDDDCSGTIDEGLSCTGACTPTGDEVCDGLDNNCNGAVDEADPRAGTSCGEMSGACTQGTLTCVAGMLRCVGGSSGRAEVCNGLDDDCDGVADDEAPCPVGSFCVSGACRRSCNPVDEFPCPPAFACEMPDGATESFCIPTACAECEADESCRDDMCINLCDGVTCTEPGATCRNGDCVDCRTTGCNVGQVCARRMCQADRCASVTCGAREGCNDGTCFAACGPEDCPAGQRCAVDGTCEPSPCGETGCPSGQMCSSSGACVADICETTTCARGQVCVAAMGCIDDPCSTVRCPAGRGCSVDDRGAILCSAGVGSADAGAVPEQVLARGGGGCSISVAGAEGGSGRGAWLGWVVLALVVASRRRAGGVA